MFKLSALNWIGNAAAVLCGQHGDVTAQVEQVGCSRQTAYDHAHKVQQAVADAQRPGPSRTQLLQEVAQLRQENRQLWDALDQAIDCPEDQQRQFTTTACAMGLSLTQVLVLLAILLPPGRLPSRASLGRWLKQSARGARRVLAVLDKACRPLVLSLCIDEIFFRRQPVLMAVQPHSFAWLVGQRAADRSGATWAGALQAWPNLVDVAADGGQGIQRGLELLEAQRQQAAQQLADGPKAKPLHVRLDVFHIRQDGARAQRQEWARAQELWEAAEKIERAKGRYDRRGKDKRHFNQAKVTKAWAKATGAFEEACRKDQAWERAVAALQLLRPDGQLNERNWAERELGAAAAELTGPGWAKVRRQLLDKRALTFLDRLQEELAVVEPCPERREALVALWRWRRQSARGQAPVGRGKGGQGNRVKVSQGEAGGVGAVVLGLVQVRLGEDWQGAYQRVSRVLSRVVRASSAVECVNSVVRMHQSRHRNLSQELLDLKRLFWNGRAFLEGKRKGRCPYELLGLKLPSYDPWVLLQMGPDQLEQHLSSLGVAA
jgi:hypothetical protein